MELEPQNGAATLLKRSGNKNDTRNYHWVYVSRLSSTIDSFTQFLTKQTYLWDHIYFTICSKFNGSWCTWFGKLIFLRSFENTWLLLGTIVFRESRSRVYSSNIHQNYITCKFACLNNKKKTRNIFNLLLGYPWPSNYRDSSVRCEQPIPNNT